MTYLLVGVAALIAVVFVLKAARRRAHGTVIIQNPALGILNLAGPSGETLLAQDLALIGPLFATTRRSEAVPPACDVMMIYCEIAPNGVVKRADRSLSSPWCKSRGELNI